jgi:ArsR family transcriptional regulator, arsenate/arsenite/antimonite-responsive transcriptional repressor
MLERALAEAYASWFRCLADPTRIQVLQLLAAHGGPMTVGEIVERVGVGQSTVSHHLKVLGQVGFVTAARAGTSSRYRVNPRCLAAFPTAADVVMGRRPPLGLSSPGSPDAAGAWPGEAR